jgi:tRNA-guanine family transglycosylase
MKTTRQIMTRKGPIRFPTYIPVTTFGKKYPLDDLVRPYLPRLAQAVMVSYHYAKQQDQPLRVPMLVDSGGFASLFERARVVEEGSLGVIEIATDNGIERINPCEVLEFQEQCADLAFTLDFPVPPGMDHAEACRRRALTIANSFWALANRRRQDMPLYACIQGWDHESYAACARAYIGAPFDGIAIGGLVPRARDEELVFGVVESVRSMHPDCPLHAFGMGKPEFVAKLFERGVDSVDSSSYIKLAADSRQWGGRTMARAMNPTDRLQLALSNLATATHASLPLGFAGIRFGTAPQSEPTRELTRP